MNEEMIQGSIDKTLQGSVDLTDELCKFFAEKNVLILDATIACLMTASIGLHDFNPELPKKFGLELFLSILEDHSESLAKEEEV